MRLWNGRQLALGNINGTGWDESFQLLYTYKDEVDKASPGSVVEIGRAHV